MNIDIKLHKEDLPDQLILSDNIAVDCEFMGLNVERDALCLVQISTGNNDAHIVKLNRDTYDAPNLKKVLEDKNIKKIFHYARADLLFIKKNLKIKDLTGAGDLFAGGFLHGLINNKSTKESLETGTEMSSKVIQIIGARL